MGGEQRSRGYHPSVMVGLGTIIVGNATATSRFEANSYNGRGYLSSVIGTRSCKCNGSFGIRASGYSTSIGTYIDLSFFGYGKVLRYFMYYYNGQATYL